MSKKVFDSRAFVVDHVIEFAVIFRRDLSCLFL